MLIEATIDRKDGDSRVAGAIIGSVAQSVGKLAIRWPLPAPWAGVLHLVLRSSNWQHQRSNWPRTRERLSNMSVLAVSGW